MFSSQKRKGDAFDSILKSDSAKFGSDKNSLSLISACRDQNFKGTHIVQTMPQASLYPSEFPRIKKNQRSTQIQVTQILEKTNKALGKKIIEQGVNQIFPGVGTTIGKGVTVVNNGLDFTNRTKLAKQRNISTSDAIICSAVGTGTMWATKRLGYTGLCITSLALPMIEGPLGVAQVVAYTIPAIAVIETSSKVVGDVSEKACYEAKEALKK